MITFNNFWELLETNGVMDSKRAECESVWNGFSAEQQQTIYANIADKIRQDKFVHYNPVRAVYDNKPKCCPQQPDGPTNYNGRALKDGVQYVSARYNGAWGLYTIEDVKLFNMETKQ